MEMFVMQPYHLFSLNIFTRTLMTKIPISPISE